jgi:TetR/AcrR family transcriptional repressor of mexJK operon
MDVLVAHPARGRKPDPAKRRAIMQAAQRLFLAQGYDVSLDAIAASAGVSKQTIYNLFGSKEDLFVATCEDTVDRLTSALVDPPADLQPRDVLSQFGRTFLEFLLDEGAIRFKRILIPLAEQYPRLTAQYYRFGPGQSRKRLADYLAMETRRGRLAVPDTLLAAEQFSGMLIGHAQICALLAIPEQAPVDVELRVTSAVTAFLRAYAP